MKKILYFLGIILMISSCKKTDSLPPSPGRMIKDFNLELGQVGKSSIYSEGDVYKVLVRVSPKADLTKIIPIIKISDNATVSPASGEPINISTTKNFTYTITAASGQVRKWEIEFRIFDPSISDYGTYSIASDATNGVIQVKGDLLFNEKYLNNALINIGAAESTTEDNLKRWQEWDIIYNSSVNNVKYYQLRNLHSGMFLNAASTNVSAGLQLKQNWELKSGIDQQLWKIEESTEVGKYIISNKATGLCLEKTGITTNTFKVVQAAVAYTTEQKWKITKLTTDSYRDGDVTNFFNRTTGSVAFDQGTSIPLSDGRDLWITQDAWYQGSLAANGNLFGNNTISYSNSIIIQPSISNWSPTAPMMTRTGAKNNIGNICPIAPGTNRNWIGSGIEIGDYVYIHGGEGNGLTGTNQAIYKIKKDASNEWSQVERLAIPNMTDQLNIGYATGMVKANDGYVYVFGSRSAPNSFGYSTLLHVARFAQGTPLNWTFWNGTTWGSTPAINAEATIDTGLGNNSVGYLNGKYIHLTMDQAFNCGVTSVNMYISTSSSPTGPFTSKKLVFNFPEFYKGYNARVYTPALHTESINGKNELLVTYSINFGACTASNNLKESDGNLDPYYYRVKGVRIPYEMFGL